MAIIPNLDETPHNSSVGIYLPANAGIRTWVGIPAFAGTGVLYEISFFQKYQRSATRAFESI
eukprot:1973482-Rhodomonas_salina.1